MSPKPPIFIELCAGTAALSLRLQGGPKAKPPVSRMGAKTGYADAILAVLGLYPGQGAESYLWCEPDDGVRGLLMAYPQPDVLRAAAAILRGWKDEEPRALWERLRAEGKYQGGTARELARWARIVSANELIPIDCESWSNTGKGGTTISINPDHEFYRPMERLCRGLESVPSLPPTFIARDGRAVTPEEVAAWSFLSNGAYRKGDIESGYDPMRSEERPATATGGRQPALLHALPVKFDRMPLWPPVTLAADARILTPPKLPPGVIAYMDPPYLNTTGYKHDLPRSEVVRMARLWADAGATVCISEAEAIPELMADGWHAVEISATRKGQKRTFTGQQKMAKKQQPAEWLTLNRPPSFVPRQTLDLFG